MDTRRLRRTMWQVVSYPSTKALSVDEAKRHLNILDTSFDTLIGEYIYAAQQMLWKEANVIAAPMTFRRYYQSWDDFSFPYDPYTSVTITYRDESDDEQTLASADYKVYSGDFPVVISPTEQPALTDMVNPITLEVVSGYSTAPDMVKQCLRMIVADFFENRQSDAPGSISQLSRNTCYQISLITRRAAV